MGKSACSFTLQKNLISEFTLKIKKLLFPFLTQSTCLRDKLLIPHNISQFISIFYKRDQLCYFYDS